MRIELPDLPYPTDALEPWISRRTLQTHHGKHQHHRAYVGQGWVAKRIAEALPRLAPSAARTALQEMHESHLANIARCEQLLV